jgi:hypothetical protein
LHKEGAALASRGERSEPPSSLPIATRILAAPGTGHGDRYTRRQWAALERYLDDGEITPDNSASERTLRGVALGRKNWLFAGSDAGGARAASLYSLIASAKRHALEPHAYLRALFERLPSHPTDRLHELGPATLAANSPSREHAEQGIHRFAQEYEAKYPKAVASLRKDKDQLLTFFDLPAEHWQHLRTTNVIESPFATVRLRQRVTKGAGSRIKALVMAYKLLDMAQQRWRRLNAPHLLPLVRAGVLFVDGVQQEREEVVTPRRKAA